MKKTGTFSPLLGQVFKKIAPRIGARVIMEPKWQIAGEVVFKSGKRCHFRYSSLDLNPLGSSEIAKDKDYANFFMKKMGYPTIPGKAFFSDEWARAIGSTDTAHAGYRYAQKMGFPVIVKPNSGSQGSNVVLVHNKNECSAAMKAVFKKDRVALVQKYITGKDYRIVVLDKRVISAYERIPLSVTGDGKSSIRTLLLQKQKQFVASSRDTTIRINDPRILQKLQRQHMRFATIPKKNETVFLLDNANLSTGGDSIDVTNTLDPKYKKVAIKLTRDMGLRLCGVDMMINEKSKKYHIIEINAAPGLDHYAKSGKEQEQIVEELYLEVLKSMEKSQY